MSGSPARPASALPIQADARELSRALSNLVTNAIRHTPQDGRVQVTAAAEADGVLMTVTDGCGGIPEADLASVFDMAWRGTKARTPRPTAARVSGSRSCAASSMPTRAG